MNGTDVEEDQDQEVDQEKGTLANLILILTVCSYHVTYAFQSESTIQISLYFKELLARNRRDI